MLLLTDYLPSAVLILLSILLALYTITMSLLGGMIYDFPGKSTLKQHLIFFGGALMFNCPVGLLLYAAYYFWP